MSDQRMLHLFGEMRAAHVPFWRPGSSLDRAKASISESVEAWLQDNAPEVSAAITEATPHDDGDAMIRVTLTAPDGASDSREFKVGPAQG
jgi:hypothetical protein